MSTLEITFNNNNKLNFNIHPSIHFLPLNPGRVAGGLEPIPAVFGR